MDYENFHCDTLGNCYKLFPNRFALHVDLLYM